MDISILHSFAFRPSFVPLGFIGKVFNKTILTYLHKFINGHLRGGVIRKCVNDNQFTNEC